jgi:hypothetical protein
MSRLLDVLSLLICPEAEDAESMGDLELAPNKRALMVEPGLPETALSESSPEPCPDVEPNLRIDG